jgi:ATP/maltotriose-dependent transcriptional regulator MalT
MLAFRRSDLRAAEADARAALAERALPVAQMVRCTAAGVLVDVLTERGELDQAQHQLENVDAGFQNRAQRPSTLVYATGRLRFAQCRFRDALAEFVAAGEVLTRAVVMSPAVIPWRSEASLAALALGEDETAQHLSEREFELA